MDLEAEEENGVLPNLAQQQSFYRQLLEKHGPTFKGVSWRTKASQDLRFEKLLTVITDDAGELVTVNDLGCGYGALFQFLVERGIAIRRYYGYDISPDMLSGLSSLGSNRIEAIQASRVTREADYSFASGVFNLRFDVPNEIWRDHVRSLLRSLAAHSRRGFAFNLLTTYNDYQEDHLFYGDPCEWFDWCKREITPRVTLLHDYPLFEWTITGFLD